MRVLLADDHAIVRQGLHALLEKKAGVKVIAQAEDGRDAVRLAEQHRPDLVIMDIAMPGLNGLEALLQIKVNNPAQPVIVLSMHIEDTYVTRALRAGASGYVYKGSAFDDLKLAMKAVREGQIFLSPAVSQVLINDLLQYRPETATEQMIEELSPREREILQLVAEQKTRAEIGKILSISVKTVDRHKENIKDKLQLKYDRELKALAKKFEFTNL